MYCTRLGPAPCPDAGHHQTRQCKRRHAGPWLDRGTSVLLHFVLLYESGVGRSATDTANCSYVRMPLTTCTTVAVLFAVHLCRLVRCQIPLSLVSHPFFSSLPVVLLFSSSLSTVFSFSFYSSTAAQNRTHEYPLQISSSGSPPSSPSQKTPPRPAPPGE